MDEKDTVSQSFSFDNTVLDLAYCAPCARPQKDSSMCMQDQGRLMNETM